MSIFNDIDYVFIVDNAIFQKRNLNPFNRYITLVLLTDTLFY